MTTSFTDQDFADITKIADEYLYLDISPYISAARPLPGVLSRPVYNAHLRPPDGFQNTSPKGLTTDECSRLECLYYKSDNLLDPHLSGRKLYHDAECSINSTINLGADDKEMLQAEMLSSVNGLGSTLFTHLTASPNNSPSRAFKNPTIKADGNPLVKVSDSQLPSHISKTPTPQPISTKLSHFKSTEAKSSEIETANIITTTANISDTSVLKAEPSRTETPEALTFQTGTPKDRTPKTPVSCHTIISLPAKANVLKPNSITPVIPPIVNDACSSISPNAVIPIGTSTPTKTFNNSVILMPENSKTAPHTATPTSSHKRDMQLTTSSASEEMPEPLGAGSYQWTEFNDIAQKWNWCLFDEAGKL